MRAVLEFAFLIVIVIFVFIYKLPTKCDTKVVYKIGSIDSRFNISKDELLSDVYEAENAWENAIGRDIFNYDPNYFDALTIRMVYDDRQAYSTQIHDSESILQSQKQNMQSRIDEYERRLADFKKRVEVLNTRIAYWNKREDISEEEYNNIIAEQKSLQDESHSLNATAQELNQTQSTYADEVKDLNAKVYTYNALLNQKPEAGLYESAPNRITLYFNDSQAELLHTIAHELGHSVGLEHLPQAETIMYAKTNDTLTPTAADLEALRAVCTNKTFYDIIRSIDWQERLQLLSQYFYNR